MCPLIDSQARVLLAMVPSNKGAEPISNAMLKLQHDRMVDWHYIAMGWPLQNGSIKSYSGRKREDCLNEHDVA